jgi:histidine triad (HIT) family protein
MRKVILGLSFSIALILVGDFYRPVSNLVIAQIAADIKARKPTLHTQPSPFEDLSELDVLAESENVMLFADINPQAPHHYLIVPKQRVYSILEASPDVMTEMMVLARDYAKQEGIADDGFRLVVNTNPDGLQSVYHLHMHLLAGRQMLWPPG